jgi:hypothetical protein
VTCFVYDLRRVALHNYDPPDLATNAANTGEPKVVTADEDAAAAAAATPSSKSLQDEFGASLSLSPGLEETTPISMGSPPSADATEQRRNSLFSASRQLDFDEGDDSDDDLL